ncbi:MAG TPA: PEGA domain-containing protein [Kofleriaceae bacterium]
MFVVWAGFCALALALWSPVANAQTAEALAKAQKAFDAAQQAYVEGRFDDAATGFQDAYEARDFPQFLYNIGAAYHMKGKKNSDGAAYEKAVEFYKKYLEKDPTAPDKAKVEKAIGVLEAEVARLKAAGTAPTGSAPAAPSAEVQSLGDVKVRGLVVIISDPPNASIYIDDKRKGEFAKTPWSGTLEGEHKVIIERRGYVINEGTIAADPQKLFTYSASMAPASYLGWVDFKSNVPGAEIFMDDKSIGAIGKTPFSQNVKPGKHTFWISSEGYDEYKEETEIIAGETKEIAAQLKGNPVGRLNISGPGIEDAQIVLDGKILCERGVCVKNVPMGDHRLLVSREGYKPYVKTITIQSKTEMKVKVVLQREASRSDAVIAYVFTGVFAGGGIYLGTKSNSIKDDLKADIKKGTPVAPNDSRFDHGKYYAWGADAAFAISAITLGTALYYTFREKGDPSTALIEVNSIALTPQIGSQYAGMGAEVHF